MWASSWGAVIFNVTTRKSGIGFLWGGLPDPREKSMLFITRLKPKERTTLNPNSQHDLSTLFVVFANGVALNPKP